MKLLKRITIIIVVTFVVIEILIEAVPNNIFSSSINKLNAGVIFYTFDDHYVTLLRQSLENIENKSEGKVKFSFYDSKNNRDIQNENINTLLESKDINLLILSLVDLVNDPKEVIDKIKDKNIPVIFVSKRTAKVDNNIVKSYDKAYYVVPDSEQAGRLQGKMIVDLWNKNKRSIDVNKDNIMQYIMLQGGLNNAETTDRSKYSIVTIQDAGIKVEQLASRVANWNEDMARKSMESLFMQYDDRIEVIIANNDSMAIGAIKTLQKYGYNQGNESKNIPVFGVDAIPEARDFMKKGCMSGTIFQDPDTMAEALYKVGVHLIANVRLDCIQEYKCDESGRIIQLPFKEYMN